MRIQISMIKVKPGRRTAVPENIEELSKSISEVGLLNPVTVDRDNTLIAGLHRLEAVKLLGWTEIECTVSSLEGLQAELAELDENFVRNDLSTVEYGELLLRRKEIYETLHPETKSGAAQAAGMNRAIGKHVSGTMPPTSKSFTADTSEKLGVSRTTIERQIRIAKNLTPEAKELIRHSDISKKTALILSRLTPDQQAEVAGLLMSGKLGSIEEYLSIHTVNPTTETTPEDRPPATTVGHLTHCAAETADGDGTAAQTAAPEPEGRRAVESRVIDRKTVGQKTAKPKSDGARDRKAQRKKSTNGNSRKVQKKEQRVDSKFQAHTVGNGQQSAVSPSEPPFTLGGKRFETFKESVADLKDPNKDCSCTPDSLLAEITEFVKKFYQEIEWFHIPYYEGVFPILSQAQLDYFRQQMDALHTAVDQLSNHVMKGKGKVHEQKK